MRMNHRVCYGYSAYAISKSITLEDRYESAFESWVGQNKKADWRGPGWSGLDCSESWENGMTASLWRGRDAIYTSRRYISENQIQIETRIRNSAKLRHLEESMTLILARKKDAKWLKKTEQLRAKIKTSERSSKQILADLERAGY